MHRALVDKSHINLFKTQTPFIDIRSPKEYQRGSLPASVNLPILLDSEYESVGIAYKKYGSKAALELGYRIVAGDIKTKRVNSWIAFIKRNPDANLFCFRGGKRSEIAKNWLFESGLKIPVVKGGYKSMRNTCIKILDFAPSEGKKWIIIGGLTGSKKTSLIKNQKTAINIEEIANHRGSAFGSFGTPQPSQVNFENKLAICYLNKKSDTIVLEDESRIIGKNYLPIAWYKKMQSSSLVIIKIPLEERIDNIYCEYIKQPLNKKMEPDKLLLSLSNSLAKIKKRIGNDRHDEIQKDMNQAFRLNKIVSHKQWIKKILVHYYDPMYKYQIERRKRLILFEGNYDNVKDYLYSNIIL